MGVEQGERLVTAIIKLAGESAEVVQTRFSASSLSGICEHVAFSPVDIASRAGVQERVARALCELLAMRFGQPLREWPGLPTPLRHRPLAADSDGRYFAPVSAMVRRGLRHTLAVNDEVDVFLEYLHDHLEFVYTVTSSARLLLTVASSTS